MYRIDKVFLAVLLAAGALTGCASNGDRARDTDAKRAQMLDEEQARREGYRQGLYDAQREQDENRPGQRLRRAPRAPLPGLPDLPARPPLAGGLFQ